MINEIIEKYLNIEEFGLNNISIIIKNNNNIFKYNVNNNELYDVASITKLFSLKLCYELIKNNLLNEDEYIYKDLRVIDIIQMRYHLDINKKLKQCKSIEDIKNDLKTVQINKNIYAEYNDIGLILLQIYLEEKFNTSYDKLMNIYVINKLSLTHTMYKPHNYKLYGNGNKLNKPHDLKTRIMNNVSAAAGIFTNCNDLLIIQELYEQGKFFDSEFLDKIYNYTFIDTMGRNRSFAGIFKYTELSKCNYVPKEYNKLTLANQGYTGSIVIFDYVNKRHISILVDAIKDSSMTKSDKYFTYFHQLKQDLIDFSLTL